MSPSQAGAREIAIGLAESLRPALVPGAPAVANVAARDVAQLMGLAGLDAALAELGAHPGPAWPVEVEHVAARISRMAEAAARDGELRVFQDADRELALLAEQLATTVWSGPDSRHGRSVPTIELGEAFADLPLHASAEALATRVTLTVASAVRAAIDWLGAEDARGAALEVNDSALTLTVEAHHAGGIGPAGAVLAAIEGSLGRETDGRWTIRVATAAERGSFLLLRQGRYGVALPWHAVARLRMFSPHELERLGEPRLAPLSTGPAPTGERPAALVALGLARAWFVADRIVWRIAAQAAEAPVASPFAGTSRAVEVESGERYWLLEPAWLLRGVAPPDAPPPSPRPRTTAAVHDAPSPAPEPAMLVPPTNESLAEAVERALAVLRRERAAAVPAPAPTPAPAPPAAPSAPPRVGPSVWSSEHAADSVMFSAAVRVIRPAEDDVVAQSPAPAAAAPVAAAPVIEPPAPVAPVAAAPVIEPPAPVATVAAAPAIEPPAPVAPVAAAPAIEPPAPVAPAPHIPAVAAHVRAPARRALVADDSLVARIFLARLLEKRGWIVETVPDAASLWRELLDGSWDLVCADIAMPDASGAAHVGRLMLVLGQREVPTPMIVLTRDAADERLAREAGASLVLRKPFDPERLDALLPN